MKYLGAAAVAVMGTLAVSTGASAAVVCNEDGDCWLVKERYQYPPEVKLEFYDDDWKWADANPPRYRWREPGMGRGYWKRGGVWVTF